MLASVYADLARKAQARQLGKYALHACDKANAYFQNSIELAEQISAKTILGQAYRDWSIFCKDKGEIDKAEKFSADASTYFRICESAVLPE